MPRTGRSGRLEVVTKGSREQGPKIGRSGRRTAVWFAWSLWAVCLVLIVLALFLDFLTSEVILRPEQEALRPGPVFGVLTGVLSLAYPTVGALIAVRLPTNPIGWIFCCIGLLYGAQRFTGAYADYALLESFVFPGGDYVAWLSMCLWLAGLVLGVFLILLFPDGRLPSRGWRIVVWAAIFGTVLNVVGFGLMPEYLFVTHPYVDNPFGIVGVIGGGFTTTRCLAAHAY